MTSNLFRQSKLPLAITLFTAMAGSVQAAPPAFQDTRALGMGGTGVAAARPSGAGLHNPSLLAAEHSDWYDGFNMTLPSVNARFADDEDTIDQVDDVQDTIDELDAILSGLDADNLTQANISNAGEQAGRLESQLNALDGAAVRFDVGAGTLFAVPDRTLGVSLHITAQGRGTVEGTVSQDDTSPLGDLNEASNESDPQDALTQAQSALNELLDSDGRLRDLNSEGRVLASAVLEAGLSFAGTLDVANQPVQLGVTPKVQNLRTFDFVANVNTFDEDDFDADEFETDETYFNLDMGASTTLGSADQWRFGAVVRNLIPRTLETAEDNGSELDDRFQREEMRLDPMVTLGIAHQSAWHTITADIDVTQNKGIGQMADRQYLALGGEINLLDWVQVRGGVRQNIDGDTGGDGIEEETQFTGGLALSPWALRAEIGALVSNEEVGGSAEFGLAF